MVNFKGLEVVGFDLDGTFYERTPEIDDRIQRRIAQAILEIMPELKDIKSAREYFDRRYQNGRGMGGRRILEEAGYGDRAAEMRDHCLATADIIDLLEEDIQLSGMLDELGERYNLFLLTSSPKDFSLQKLRKLGIEERSFRFRFYGDDEEGRNKSNGKQFEHALASVGVEPSKVAYIGDSYKADAVPARRLGMNTILVGKNFTEEEIHSANAHVERIHDIRRLLL